MDSEEVRRLPRGSSLSDQWVGLDVFTAMVQVGVPGWGTKDPPNRTGRDARLWLGFLARGEEPGWVGLAAEGAAGAEAAPFCSQADFIRSLRQEQFRGGLRPSIPSRSVCAAGRQSYQRLHLLLSSISFVQMLWILAT